MGWGETKKENITQDELVEALIKYGEEAINRANIIKSLEQPILCYFCNEPITQLKGHRKNSLHIHSLDENHDNFSLNNKVPSHCSCHISYHAKKDGRGKRAYKHVKDLPAKRGVYYGMSNRRHRLNYIEVPVVIDSLKSFLWYHLENRDSLESAQIAFRAYYRLVTHRVGKPCYPEPITWSLIESWVGSTPYEMVPLIVPAMGGELR